MSATGIAVAGWGAMAVVMALLWVRQRRTGNAATVDAAWAFGTGLVGAALALAADGWGPRRVLVAALATAWGLRLGFHLLARLRRDDREDVRYRELRRRLGERAQSVLFVFFQLQAAWVVLFALPMHFAARNPVPRFGALDVLGVLLWVAAVLGEALADRQLARFRNDPANRGTVCRAGLWRTSRHPNYFFEWVHWWAYVAIGIPGPHGWLTLAGPAVMLLFLWKVTGIPILEERLVESRGEAYREYQRTTSPFLPWPPRRSA